MRKLAAGAAVLVVIAGVTVAVVSKGHNGNPVRQAARARRAARPDAGVNILRAARYLGVSRRRLRSELRAGTTLAQVADATAGRSQAGLIGALVNAKRRRLAAEVSAERARLARFTARIGVLVDRT
jgi:hypothetical protein